jgi:hypothetical protein
MPKYMRLLGGPMDGWEAVCLRSVPSMKFKVCHNFLMWDDGIDGVKKIFGLELACSVKAKYVLSRETSRQVHYQWDPDYSGSIEVLG